MASKLAPTPKVAAAVLGGIIASALLANVTLITPDLFDGLGKWSGLVYGLTITFIMGAAGWLKSEGDKASGGTASDQSAPDLAPVSTYPAAKVEAAQASALAAVEPAPVAPVFEPPAPAPQ